MEVNTTEFANLLNVCTFFYVAIHIFTSVYGFLRNRLRPVLSVNRPVRREIPQFATVLTRLLGHQDPTLYDVIKGSITLLVLDSLLTLLFYPLTNIWKVKQGVIGNVAAQKRAFFVEGYKTEG